ncbi:hypothetical protein [Microbacterium sp. bgisy207]|uniref:hypothetical protein n=1 Tax=Microbacterium sp. bgisy207 TaxID=3413800 RepID=UPI003EB9413E
MTNEQQPNQPLTRRQLRELRSTGATPILTPEGTPVMPAAPAPESDAAAPGAGGPTDAADSPHIPEPADGATEQEPSAATAPEPEVAPEGPAAAAPHATSPESTVSVGDSAPLTRRRARERTGNTDAVAVSERDGDHRAPFVSAPPEEHPISQAAAGLAVEDSTERGTVSPQLGAALLAGIATEPDPRPSFDQLIARPSAGSTGTGSSLIVTDSPPQGITAPVNATGEVLVTGSLALPDLFATTGQMPGASEGLDIDATFADGELPQHSSPTPIAASAAISTVKTTAEIIKPPAPEKGSRLMLALAITAGVLALALVGVLILAFATGVFS